MLNLGKPITCFAFNGNNSEMAIGLADGSVQIFKQGQDRGKPVWNKINVLEKHEGRVTGVDWAPNSDKIVTVSSDRNAFVWTRSGGDWVPELVLLRIPRAATCVKWSPNEQKFAAGSSARLVAVCYYEKDQKCWVSKHIKKPIKSTVICLDWHPEGYLLAAGSSDLTCRVMSAYIKDMEKKPTTNEHPGTYGWASKLPFATVVAEWKCGGWVSAVKFQGSGENVAFAAHDSTVNVGSAKALTTHYSKSLPITDISWSAADKLVGVGHDRCPYEYAWNGSEISFCGKHTGKGAAKSGGFGNAMKAFQNMDLRAQSNSAEIDTVHSAPISSMRISQGQEGAIREFVTTGGEGLVYLWNWAQLSNNLMQ